MKNAKSGFTLLEVLVVVIIIGIMSALAWAGMNELIQANRAKEAARILTAFAERAVAEGKRLKEPVIISINGNTIEAHLNEDDPSTLFSQSLANGFSANYAILAPNNLCESTKNSDITSEIRIGISGIDGTRCFVVCNAGNYCGSAVKIPDKNTFSAWIKRKNSATWEAL